MTLLECGIAVLRTVGKRVGLGAVRKAGGCFILAAGTALWSDTGSAAPDIVGIWLTEDRDSKIEFVQCGEALCGRVVWLLRPTDANGRPYTDIRNPDTLLRSRPILGLTIFQDLKQSEDEPEWEGSVYNPDDGETYKTYLSVSPDGVLEVKGCVLGGLICDSEYWTPASE